MAELDPAKLWCQTNLVVFLNHWFSNYEDARASRETGAERQRQRKLTCHSAATSAYSCSVLSTIC